jgi:hypothetical protein
MSIILLIPRPPGRGLGNRASARGVFGVEQIAVHVAQLLFRERIDGKVGLDGLGYERAPVRDSRRRRSEDLVSTNGQSAFARGSCHVDLTHGSSANG